MRGAHGGTPLQDGRVVAAYQSDSATYPTVSPFNPDQSYPEYKMGKTGAEPNNAYDGRLEDYIDLKNGTKLGRLDHLFKDMINIREAQICQRSSGELLIRVVPSDHYTDADERTLLRETRLRVGDNVEIEIERVEKIERTANGKLRFVVSDVRES